MKNRGYFKKKEVPFSQVSNEALRNPKLSLRAKGLYAVIQSYISIPDFTLYKTHLQEISQLGEKAFNTVWKELKDMGYLKQARIRTENGFAYEYELREQADFETPALVNVGLDGEIVSKAEQENAVVEPPPFGRGFKDYPIDKGGNINNIDNNNTYVMSEIVSYTAEAEKKSRSQKEAIREEVREYLNTYQQLPEYIGASRIRCTAAIRLLMGYENNRSCLEDSMGKANCELLEYSLNHLCTAKKPVSLCGEQIKGSDVIRKLNEVFEMYDGTDIYSAFERFALEVIDDYRKTCMTQNVQKKQACMQTCIWHRLCLSGSSDNSCNPENNQENGISRAEIREYLVHNHELPFTILNSESSCTQAVHLLTHYERGYSSDQLTQAAFELANYSLIEMMMSRETINLRGALITGSKVLENLNRHITFDDNGYYPFAFDVIEDIVEDYRKAEMKATRKNQTIKNKVRYMQSCIWTRLVTQHVYEGIMLEQIKNL